VKADIAKADSNKAKADKNYVANKAVASNVAIEANEAIEADADEHFEILELLLDAHRLGKGLVAIP
jgi:hypothetical protein